MKPRKPKPSAARKRMNGYRLTMPSPSMTARKTSSRPRSMMGCAKIFAGSIERKASVWGSMAPAALATRAPRQDHRPTLAARIMAIAGSLLSAVSSVSPLAAASISSTVMALAFLSVWLSVLISLAFRTSFFFSARRVAISSALALRATHCSVAAS
ncbi:MAG: hypothetical protein EXS40_05485 [Opitutaceae bacterium]|nr:hypothetical protein [Opitutaceae bacterium]